MFQCWGNTGTRDYTWNMFESTQQGWYHEPSYKQDIVISGCLSKNGDDSLTCNICIQFPPKSYQKNVGYLQ
jgi:hypothetical protein